MSEQKVYTGIDRYPGLIATIITVVVGVAFIGGLVATAQSHHGGGGEHGSDAAPAEEAAQH